MVGLGTPKSPSKVASSIVAALTNSPNAFKIIKASSPETDTYEIAAQQTGFLHATERECLIVVGSQGDTGTEVRFKVLEFEVQHHLGGYDQLIPMGRSKVEGNGLLLLHVKAGLQIVTKKITEAISESGNSKDVQQFGS